MIHLGGRPVVGFGDDPKLKVAASPRFGTWWVLVPIVGLAGLTYWKGEEIENYINDWVYGGETGYDLVNLSDNFVVGRFSNLKDAKSRAAELFRQGIEVRIQRTQRRGPL